MTLCSRIQPLCQRGKQLVRAGGNGCSTLIFTQGNVRGIWSLTDTCVTDRGARTPSKVDTLGHPFEQRIYNLEAISLRIQNYNGHYFKVNARPSLV